MNCEHYQKHELGQLDEDKYTAHVQTCVDCQKLQQQDAHLLSVAENLNRNVQAPMLWSKIENRLRAESQRRPFPWQRVRSVSLYPVLRLAAILVLVIGLGAGSYFLFHSSGNHSGILAASRLARVEKIEQEYVNAIAELEEEAAPQLSRIDQELMLLYRDRLETIDAQIARCMEALQNNPANAHIRRYLLAALQDKKQTLVEILNNQATVL